MDLDRTGLGLQRLCSSFKDLVGDGEAPARFVVSFFLSLEDEVVLNLGIFNLLNMLSFEVFDFEAWLFSKLGSGEDERTPSETSLLCSPSLLEMVELQSDTSVKLDPGRSETKRID